MEPANNPRRSLIPSNRNNDSVSTTLAANERISTVERESAKAIAALMMISAAAQSRDRVSIDNVIRASAITHDTTAVGSPSSAK